MPFWLWDPFTIISIALYLYRSTYAISTRTPLVVIVVISPARFCFSVGWKISYAMSLGPQCNIVEITESSP